MAERELKGLAAIIAALAGLFLITRKPKAECPMGFRWDEATQQCVPLPVPECPPGWEWNENEGMCVKLTPVPPPPPPDCGPGFYWDPDLRQCVSICGVGEVWDEETERCVRVVEECPEGTVWSAEKGECIPVLPPPGPPEECPEGTVWNDDLQDCVPTPLPPEPPPPPPEPPPPVTPNNFNLLAVGFHEDYDAWQARWWDWEAAKWLHTEVAPLGDPVLVTDANLNEVRLRVYVEILGHLSLFNEYRLYGIVAGGTYQLNVLTGVVSRVS